MSLLEQILAKSFKFTNRIGAEEVFDKSDEVIGYKPWAVKAIDDGKSEVRLDKVYFEEFNKVFDTESEARDFACSFLHSLPKNTIFR